MNHRIHLPYRSIRLGIVAVAALVLGQACVVPEPTPGLDPDNQRVAFSSQCALNVIECTTSWPTAVLNFIAGEGQTVTPTADGFRVEGSDGNGTELVQFMGSDSDMGETATLITYEWSAGATDDDERTLEPGEIFSTEADPEQFLKSGFHYIRLTVRNDVFRDEVVSNEHGVLFEDILSFDFVEVEVEVVD